MVYFTPSSDADTQSSAPAVHEIATEGDDDAPVRAIPAVGNQPPIWLLGSSEITAELAGGLGLPYAFAHHLKARNTATTLGTYRRSFRPSEHLSQPYVMLSVSVIAADTDEDAEWIAGPSKLKYLRRHQHKPIVVPTPEQAAGYSYSDTGTSTITKGFADKFVGSAETVRRSLQELLHSTDADELMVTTRVHDPAARQRSYSLLAAGSG